MSKAESPDPSTPQVTPPGEAVTSIVVEQRPVGDYARGSYVWPAWVVLSLAVGAVGLWLGVRLRERLTRKAPLE